MNRLRGPSAWMVAYGLFLVAGALTAISISGWDKSKTALMSSGMAALMMTGCAVASASSRGWLQGLGGWAGRVLPLLFAATFAWRLSLNRAKPSAEEWLAANPGQQLQTAAVESALQNWLFPTFIAGSLVAAGLIWATGRARGS